MEDDSGLSLPTRSGRLRWHGSHTDSAMITRSVMRHNRAKWALRALWCAICVANQMRFWQHVRQKEQEAPMDFQGMSDHALLVELGERLQRTRLNRNLTQPEIPQLRRVLPRPFQSRQFRNSGLYFPDLLRNRKDEVLPFRSC